ncbi:MAG: hypothetical protein Kow0059_01340 [Candidatus Sumerlaeia bacterium]
MIALAKKGRFEEVEELWLDFLGSAPADPGLFIQILRVIGHSKAADTGLTMLLLALEHWRERDRWDVIYEMVVGLAASWPQSGELRALMIEALRRRHGHLPQFAAMLNSSGLDGEAPLGDAVERFRFFLNALPGQCYRYAGKGVGVVVSADFERDQFVLDFPGDRGRVFTSQGVREFLIHLPPDHFLARRATDAEGLAELAEEDPAELVRLVARSFGGRVKQGELKEYLLDGVLDPERWPSWWSKARAAIKLDPLLDFQGTGGAHAEISLRAEPKTLADEILERFFRPDTTRAHQAAEIKNLQSLRAVAPPDPQLLGRMLAHLKRQYEDAQDGPVAARVELALMAQDLLHLLPEAADEADVASIPTPHEVLADVSDYSILGDMENDEYALRALELMAARDGEAALERMAAALPAVPSKVAQAFWRDLGDPSRRALCYPAVKQLLAVPMSRPDTWLWVVKGLVEQRWPHLNDYFPLSVLVPELLDLLDQWSAFAEKFKESAQSADAVKTAKQLISRVKAMLRAGQCRAIYDVALTLPPRALDDLERRLLRHAWLDNEFRSDAVRRLGAARRVLEEQEPQAPRPAPAADARPGQGAPDQPSSAPPSDADGADTVHYCTAAARERKILELQKLKTETIPANTRMMEEARQEGDLRENAAYHAAKDRHAFLANLSAQLQLQIQTARVFTADMVKPGVIGFGVRFTALNLQTGAEETYTVLGRWEADTERHILNYQAPFVQQFMGKGVGDVVQVFPAGSGGQGEPTSYRITRIENALLSDGGSAAPAFGSGGTSKQDSFQEIR